MSDCFLMYGQSTLCLNSSDDPSGWESVRVEPDESASCESPSDPPSHQNFDVSGYVGVEEQQVEEDIVKEDLSVSSSSSSDGETLSGASLIQEYCAGNLTSAGDDEESQISNTLTPQKVSAEERNVEEVRVESFRDYVSRESQSCKSLVESFGSVVKCNDGPATLGISIDDSNINQTETKSSDAPVEDNVANMRSSNEGWCFTYPLLSSGYATVCRRLNPLVIVLTCFINCNMCNSFFFVSVDNPDDVIHDKSDAALLDTKALSGMTFREDPTCVDDNELYALHVRTKKLRSVKVPCFLLDVCLL